jgi:hypothetical protein
VPLHDDDDDDDDDDDVMILGQPSRPTASRKADGPAIPNGGKNVQKRQKEGVIPNGGKKVQKRQKEAEVAHMMEKYLEVRTKQVEVEVAEKSRQDQEQMNTPSSNALVSSLISTMVELTGEEKAEAFDVFQRCSEPGNLHECRFTNTSDLEKEEMVSCLVLSLSLLTFFLLLS